MFLKTRRDELDAQRQADMASVEAKLAKHRSVMLESKQLIESARSKGVTHFFAKSAAEVEARQVTKKMDVEATANDTNEETAQNNKVMRYLIMFCLLL